MLTHGSENEMQKMKAGGLKKLSEVNEVKVPGGSKKRIIIIVLAVVFILGLLGYRISANYRTAEIPEELPVNVKAAQAALMSIYATSPISGRIQPIEEVVIIPLASGEITRVYVSMGDKVSKGTRLFEIDRSQIAALANTLNQAREALNSAQTAYERTQALYNEGAVSLQAFEQAQTQLVTARETHSAASSNYSNAHNNTTVTSPIDGYVTSLSASVGSLASPGVPAATIADVSELKVDTFVSEYLAPRLKVGDPVDIHIATLGDKTYSGIITAVSPAPATGSLTYPISISVADEGGEVMAGMFAEIRIVSDEKDEVLCVPSDAVIIKSGRSIVVVIKDNIPEFKEVTTGIDNGEYVEIISGLSEGETIAILGQQYAKEGVAVNIIE
jgi:RND family efflux transporter MFP subunit